MAKRKSGHATGMAGEFFVMERLFREGHEPALTLGNAKNIDIIVEIGGGELKTISVKSVCGGGKWGVGKEDLSDKRNLVFVFLNYESNKKFKDLKLNPKVWVVPAPEVEKRKRKWLGDSFAIYYSHKKHCPADLDQFLDKWDY